jgi:hypothetical protein
MILLFTTLNRLRKPSDFANPQTSINLRLRKPSTDFANPQTSINDNGVIRIHFDWQELRYGTDDLFL